MPDTDANHTQPIAKQAVDVRFDMAASMAREIAARPIRDLEATIDFIMSDEATEHYRTLYGATYQLENPCVREIRFAALRAIRVRVQPVVDFRLKAKKKPTKSLERILSKIAKGLEEMGMAGILEDPTMPPVFLPEVAETMDRATAWFRDQAADKPKQFDKDKVVPTSTGLGSRLAGRKASA